MLLSGNRANEAMMSQIDQDREKAAKYAEEQSEIQKEAQQKQTDAESDFHQHEVFARGVTLFQIAIAIGAIQRSRGGNAIGP